MTARGYRASMTSPAMPANSSSYRTPRCRICHTKPRCAIGLSRQSENSIFAAPDWSIRLEELSHMRQLVDNKGRK